MSDIPKLAVILGAGASADSWNPSGPPRGVHWQPPLARELFGQREAFWEVLGRYPGVRVLASELSELAGSGTINIEAKLREYATHHDERIRNHFKEVPLYLRDLIVSVVRQFTRGISPGNHVRLVMSLLSHNVEVLFLDLNYDPYIEMALGEFDPKLAIQRIEDYAAPGRRAIVCKVHGAIDWGMPMGPLDWPWRDALTEFDVGSRAKNIIFNRTRQVSTEWTNDGKTRLYPVLTAPLAGKGHADLVCPAEHLDAAREFLRGCHQYLIIGTSGQDEDLLGLLSSCASTIVTAHYVSNSVENAETVRARFARACPAFADADTVIHAGGFRVYLGSTEFRQLL